jgi:hypothetical protein
MTTEIVAGVWCRRPHTRQVGAGSHFIQVKFISRATLAFAPLEWRADGPKACHRHHAQIAFDRRSADRWRW